MPGWEVVDDAEMFSVQDVFSQNKGVAFAHGFDKVRIRFFVRELEKATAEMVGAKYCQAVSSGSAGLYCALRALGVGPGDEVITSCFTFIATVEAILLTGARPVCVDIDDSFNLDPVCVEKAITPKTKVIMPVHMGGACADMDKIIALAEEHDLKVVEDACQAMGAQYNGSWSGTLGDIGVYSLDAGKVIQSGEGGLIVTNNKELYERCRMAHDHGHDYNGPGRALEIPQMVGFNFRMTELQAAYALAQLRKLPAILKAQRVNDYLVRDKIDWVNVRRQSGSDQIYPDAGDCIIVIFDTQEQAGLAVKALASEGVGTKNIPDALIWHFAGNWGHVFIEDKWARSRALLYRSVAIPIPVKMPEDYPNRVAYALEDAR
jgi:8-amino-3,8-dideoxy-alpha-D-manno-octulosonate transaminase